MNQYLLLALCLIAGYLIGSILFAIIITKLFIGKDIRTIGNKNPGASNTIREAGPIAGILVSILDIAKAIVPIIIAKAFLFTLDTTLDWLALYLIGMAVVLGHCRPFWNKFKKGGGGMGAALGIGIFFIPIELAVSILLGMLVAFTVMKNAEFKFGRWTFAFAAVFTPFVVLLSNQLFNIKLFWHFSIGGHSVGVVIGAFLLLIELLILNSYELFHWLKNPKDKVNPDRQ